VETKIIRMVSVHCHAHRLVLACYYAAADLCSLVYETAKALSCNYGSVLLFHRYDRLAWRCIRLQWRQKVGICSAYAKQGGCRVRQQWEQGVRFWLFGPHWCRCQKIKMMAMCVISLRLMKTKNVQHGAFLFPTLAPRECCRSTALMGAACWPSSSCIPAQVVSVSTGVKSLLFSFGVAIRQWCVLSPLLFIVYIRVLQLRLAGQIWPVKPFHLAAKHNLPIMKK